MTPIKSIPSSPPAGLTQTISEAGFHVQSIMQPDQVTQIWHTEEADLKAVEAIIAAHDPKAWLTAQEIAALGEQTRAAIGSKGLMELIDTATKPLTADDILAHIVDTANAHIEAKAEILAKAEADAPATP